jgi:hypothetical protein
MVKAVSYLWEKHKGGIQDSIKANENLPLCNGYEKCLNQDKEID